MPVRYFSLLTGIGRGRIERADGMLLFSEAEAFVGASYRLSGRNDLGRKRLGRLRDSVGYASATSPCALRSNAVGGFPIR